MAYVTYYTINFHNHLNEELLIEIQRKDGIATTPEELTATELKINSEADGDGLYSPIIRKNIELVVNLSDSDSVTWETFFDQQHDEWRIEITNDNQKIFTGFMLPDEGTVPFEDKPYDLTIRAADGLKLLSNVSLKKPDGTNFKGKYTFIQYIAACLFWTGLELPIKIYCDIFEGSMDDRGVSIDNDMFAQAKLDHRTFQKDPVEFVSCFEALEIMFKGHFRIHQDYDLTTDQQVWCIDRIPQYQYTPAPIVYYTIYDFDGTNPTGYEDPENYGLVGKSNLIYKTNQVNRSGKFAAKTTTTEFKYLQWPELPLNNTFQRGTLIPLLSGVNYTAWTIDDWEYGIVSPASTNPAFPFTITPTSASRVYSKRTFNVYGVELSREIVMTHSGANTTWLRSEGIPVNMGDKIEISFNQRYTQNFGPGPVFGEAMRAYITDGATYKYLDNSNGDRVVSWRTGAGGSVVVDYAGTTTEEFSSINVDAPPIPFDGTLYIALPYFPTGLSASTQIIRSGFELRYLPYISNGYIPVKGDKWTRSQDANYIDVTTEEIKISDSIPKAIKGCIWKETGTTNTSPTWYRYGLTETRHYKELVNIGRFNTEYRRFFEFNGTFTSTKFSPENDLTRVQPISFRKTYKFMDVAEEPECVLVPPLTIDYKTGWITAVFQEVRRESATPIMETLEAFIQRVILAINNTTEAEWISGSGTTPASGTVAFPPVASLAGVPNTINIGINDADNMTAVVTVGGGGNSPSITETFNGDLGPYRAQQFEFGTDIATGNTFTFTAYGHDVSVTVQAVPGGSDDGRNLGDTSDFNYLFE